MGSMTANAQSGQAPSIEAFVADAEARAAGLKATLGLNDVRTHSDYTAQARLLAAGNRDRLRKGMPYLSPDYNIDPYAPPADEGQGALYVAVSLSMPKPSLRQLARDTQRAGGVLVIRGLVDGSFSKTQIALKGIFSEGEAAGLVIDPRVFQQFAIDRVPTFVVAQTDVESCEQGFDCARPEVPFDQVRGNVSLTNALELLAGRGTVAPGIAAAALARMER